jgi:double stranded RNA-specific editase B
VENLPEMYKLNVPRLNLLSSPEVRQPGKAPNYSVNWAKGYDLPEVIDAMKGKEQVTKVS